MFDSRGNQRKSIPSWLWILLLVPLSVLIRWLIWWFLCPSYKRTSAVEIDAPRSDLTPIPIQIQQDDFSKLKGIGPKTAEVFYSSGIFTFKQLGLMDKKELDRLFKDHSISTSKSAFWQKQAVLAAAQDWDGLKKIQK